MPPNLHILPVEDLGVSVTHVVQGQLCTIFTLNSVDWLRMKGQCGASAICSKIYQQYASPHNVRYYSGGCAFLTALYPSCYPRVGTRRLDTGNALVPAVSQRRAFNLSATLH